MKKKSLVLIAFLAMSSFVGCGRVYTGSYIGTQTIALTGSTITNGATELNGAFNQNGNMISGTITGTGISGTLQGSIMSGDTLQVTLVLTGTGTTAGAYQYNSFPLNTSCTYTGTMIATGVWPGTVLEFDLAPNGNLVCPKVKGKLVRLPS